MLHTVIFIGRSGCGKGTQADLLKNRIAHMEENKRQILYIETGEHFRKFIRSKGFSSDLSNKVYEKSERQPDFLASWMWSGVLVDELDANMHIIFDGAPRSLVESMALTSAMKFYERKNPTIIYLNVSRRWSEDRLLSRGRSDDRSIQKINTRLDWFETDTMPAVEYFKKNKLFNFVEINGEQSIEKVHSDIIAAYEYSS